MSLAARRPPASPCIGTCVIDDAAALCTGCARSLDEIAVWGSSDDAFRARVWADLPARATRLGIAARKLSLGGAALLDMVAERVCHGAPLQAGVWGALGEIGVTPGRRATVAQGADGLTLRVPGGAVRIAQADRLTGFDIARPDGDPLIALALPQGRAFRDTATGLTALGPDMDALLPRDAGAARFDLGLGRSAARFSIRCDAALTALVTRALGMPFPAYLGPLALPLRHAAPVRVIETPGLRMEIDAPIPGPGGTSPRGPHTHLLPDHVAMGLDTPPTAPLPRGWVAVCLIG